MIFRQDVDERQQQQQDKLKSKTSQLGSSRQNKNGILPSLSLLEKQDETSRSSTILSSSNTESIEFVDDDEDKGEMSLFVARGILLLVAAIWGTNFAVREGPTLRVLRRRTEKWAFIYKLTKLCWSEICAVRKIPRKFMFPPALPSPSF